MHKIISYLLTIICCVNVAFAQPKSTEPRAFDQAQKAFKLESYFDAIGLYKKALTKEKGQKPLITYQIAQAYRLANDMKNAAEWYSKALANGYNEPEIYPNYAMTLRKMERYDEAIQQYNTFLGTKPNDVATKNDIASTQAAKLWASTQTRFVVINAKQFNTKYADYAAMTFKQNGIVVSAARPDANGKKVFGRTGEKFSDLYETYVDKKGKWSALKPLQGQVNSPANEGAVCFNKTNTEMYFTRCDAKKGGCRIYSSQKTDKWSEPKPLPLFGDTSKIVVGHPALSPDNKTLYFSALDAPDGFGGRDIYYATRQGNGWSKPINAGEAINTPKDEVFPAIHKDNILYFSSNGLYGMGGLDIFMATMTGKEFGTPMNLRAPLNSGGDDFAFVANAKRNKGFLSSNREGGRGSDDIYEWELTPLLFNLNGIITDINTKKPVQGAAVKLILPDSTYIETNTDATGKYTFKLNENTPYRILANRKGYFGSSSEKITTVGEELSKDYDLNISLNPIPIKELTLEDILYDLDSDKLRGESKMSLDKLVKLLNDSPELKIGVYSHTDSRGSDDYNLNLSQRRAESVLRYLTEKNISADRLTAKGFGETQLLNKCSNDIACTEEEHQINRRTTYQVLSTDYKGKIIYKKASGENAIDDKSVLD